MLHIFTQCFNASSTKAQTIAKSCLIMVKSFMFFYKRSCSGSRPWALKVFFMITIELSEILALLRFRPKALRFEKELLITMHVRF